MNHPIKRSFWLALLTITILVQPISAQQSNNYADKIKAFEEFVEKQMEIDQIPGMSIGFMKDNFIWTKGFGYADMENKTPASARSTYRLASNTKSMTAVAILQLLEKGKVKLDADVRTYVPYFPRKRWSITVRQLLGHLAGISHYKNYDVEGHIKEHKDTRDALAIFADFDLVAEPGTKFNYSSYGYNLLGAVTESAAKQSYGDYLQENLWKPLNMNDTYMDDPTEIIPNRIRGYRLINGKVKNSEFVDISSRFAAGGTRSTVVDLLKYAKALRSEKVLTLESIDLMYTSMTTKDGHFTDYGMGWVITPVNGRFHVYHTGGQPETRTLLLRFPKENFAIALAYNLEGANLHVYSHRLAQLILEEPWNMRVYTGSKVDDALYSGIWNIFNHGLGYYDRYQKARSADSTELAKAFAYFNGAVNRDSLLANFKNTFKKIRDGRHPVANEAFVKIGSYIAARLHEKFGTQRLESYHKSGAISFFNDYFKICKLDPNHLKALCFTDKLEKTLAQWQRDWKKTHTEYTRRLVISPFTNPEQIGKKLKQLFSNAKVYPDFSQDFAAITRYFYVNGDQQRAFELANLALDLYPASPLPYVISANTHICFGQKDKARQFYKKALEINPDDRFISARSLNQEALDLIRFGNYDAAMDLLKTAIELYPKETRLYNSIAEIYLQKGKRYFEKALKIDPTDETARKWLKKL